MRRAVSTRLPLLLGAVGALVLAGCDVEQDVFSPEGEPARKINDLQWPIFVVAGVVGLLVFALVGIAVWRGRRHYRSDEDDPVQLEGNFRLEIGWTIAPAVLLAVISVPTVLTIFSIDDDAGASQFDDIEITVFGQQWWWSYEYDLDPDANNGPEIVTANDLVIPAGETMTLRIESRDVIHSFWIPSLAGTRDAVPGRSHTLAIAADEPGEYVGQCKEFCGLSHANMRARVVALSASEFETWLDQQQQQYERASGSGAADNEDAFVNNLCASCHLVRGLNDDRATEAAGLLVAGVAPDLTHFMSREVFAGGMFDLYDPVTGEFNRAAVEEWLRNPTEAKPMAPAAEGQGRGMPDLELSEEQIDQLVDFLMTLGPRPPSPTGPEISNEADS